MKKVFIDGSAGTTGLRIAQRLANREDLELLTIPEDKRKDVAVKKRTSLGGASPDSVREQVEFIRNELERN